VAAAALPGTGAAPGRRAAAAVTTPGAPLAAEVPVPVPAGAPVPIHAAPAAAAAMPAATPIQAAVGALAGAATRHPGDPRPAEPVSGDAGQGNSVPIPLPITIPAPAGAPVTTAAPTPATQVPASPAAQVVNHLLPLATAPDGIHRLTVHLHPAELGPVSVTADLRGNQIHLHLAAATDIGREALRAALPDLHRELQSAGFDTASLDVRHEPPAHQQPGQQPAARQPGEQPAESRRPVPAPANTAPTGDTRTENSLDLRV
jgi:hypothetical protein